MLEANAEASKTSQGVRSLTMEVAILMITIYTSVITYGLLTVFHQNVWLQTTVYGTIKTFVFTF